MIRRLILGGFDRWRWQGSGFCAMDPSSSSRDCFESTSCADAAARLEVDAAVDAILSILPRQLSWVSASTCLVVCLLAKGAAFAS